MHAMAYACEKGMSIGNGRLKEKKVLCVSDWQVAWVFAKDAL